MKAQLLVAPKDVKVVTEGYRVEGVFNPGVAEVKGEVHLLLRVAESSLEQRPGYVSLPRYQSGLGYINDWVGQNEISVLNRRGVLIRRDGRHRFTTISHLRHAVSRDGLHINSIADTPALAPTKSYEEYGVEDARITPIGHSYYVTYVAVSRHGIATALASTKDFEHFERHGIIFPPENKNVVIFPEQIAGYYYALHRPNGRTPLGVPGLWLSRSKDLINWGQHQALTRKRDSSDYTRFGAGAPPMRVEEGWLVFFHAVQETSVTRGPGKYNILAMLLDSDDPSNVLAETVEPILQVGDREKSTEEFDEVIFPTGGIERGSDIFLYCGEKDTYTTVLKIAKEAILSSMR